MFSNTLQGFFKKLYDIFCYFLMFANLLTVFFLFCIVVSGDFFFIVDDLFFCFTLYKINPTFLQKLVFLPFFYFYPENITFSWFDIPIVVNERYFFNAKSAFYFIGGVLFSFLFSFISPHLFFSLLGCKNIVLKSLIYFLFFFVFIYFFFTLVFVFLESPPLHYFSECLINNIVYPVNYFPEVIWHSSYINRSCVLCYRDHSSELGNLVDQAFAYFAYISCIDGGVPSFVNCFPEVIQLKGQCVQMLLNQCPESAQDLILQYLHTFFLPKFARFFEF
jgi:hypothetical protein